MGINIVDKKKDKSKLGCIILASGFSQRFGSANKLITPFRGKSLAEYILKAVTESSFACTVCVTQWTEITALAELYGIPPLVHNFPEKKDTIRLGIDFLLEQKYACDDFSLDGIMFCTADQPLLRATTIRNLCDEFSHCPQNIVRAAHAEDVKGKLCPGNPVIFPASLFDELRTLHLGQNGRDVIARHKGIVHLVPVQNKNELIDIDTPEQLTQLEEIL